MLVKRAVTDLPILAEWQGEHIVLQGVRIQHQALWLSVVWLERQMHCLLATDSAGA